MQFRIPAQGGKCSAVFADGFRRDQLCGSGRAFGRSASDSARPPLVAGPNGSVVLRVFLELFRIPAGSRMAGGPVLNEMGLRGRLSYLVDRNSGCGTGEWIARAARCAPATRHRRKRRLSCRVESHRALLFRRAARIGERSGGCRREIGSGTEYSARRPGSATYGWRAMFLVLG